MTRRGYRIRARCQQYFHGIRGLAGFAYGMSGLPWSTFLALNFVALGVSSVRGLINTVALQGIEEVLLPSGWGVAGSPEYWSVGLLWWLKAGQKIDEAVLQQNMQAYYDGLSNKMGATKVQIKTIGTEPDDVRTYMGTVDMLDFMAMKPLRLNFVAHVRDWGDPGHFPVFLELSPKPYDDAIWDQLKQLKKRFKLNN